MIAAAWFMVCLAGCWDYRDINKVNFPLAGAYDLHPASRTGNDEKDELYDLTVILPNLAEDAREKYRVEKTTGFSIGQARGNKAYSSAGPYSAGGSLVIIAGEELAKKGLSGVYESLFRAPLISSIQNLAVAEGRAESIMEVQVKDYPSMADFLKGLLPKANERGFIPSITLHQFEMSQAPGRNPFLPLIKAHRGEAAIIGGAIFKKDRMIGKANLAETRCILLLRGVKCTGNLPFVISREGRPLDRGSVDIRNSREVKIVGSPGNISYTIKIKLKGSLVEHECKLSLSKDENLKKMIEEQISSNVKNECERYVKVIQEKHKVDCIDISKYALAKWGKQIEAEIDKDFIENVDIKVEVETKLTDIGELN